MPKKRTLRILLPMMVAGLLIAVLGVGKCGPSRVEKLRKEEAKKPDLIRESGPQSLDKWIVRFDRQVPPPVEPLAYPSQTRGQLSNGLRYIVVENPENAGEVSLRLLVLSGSAHEGESEAGFAHFVEHMAFRTTAHRTDEGVMARFERLGLTSGADTNAHTARDHTLYRLDLPEADDSSLDEAFRFMRDVTDGMLFLPDEVEVEKAVVLREMDQRRYLTGFDARVALVLPEVPVAMASPIGKLETIESATPDSLRAFWERCYVPSRMVLVVVGDFTRDAMEAMIKRHFETLERKDEVQEPELGDPLGGNREPRAYCFRNDDQKNVRVALAVAQPIDRVPDDRGKRRDAMVRRLGLRMMTDRIADGCLDSRLAVTGFACGEVEVVPGIRWLEISGVTDFRPGFVFSSFCCQLAARAGIWIH